MSFAYKCDNIPAPGGQGCHPALLSAANAGVREGLDDSDIFDGIRDGIPPGTREVPDKEIWDTIRTARADGGTVPRAVSKTFLVPPAIRGAELRADLAAASVDVSGNELRSMSKVTMPVDPNQQFQLFIRSLYHPEDRVYCGPEMSAGAEHIHRAGDLATMAPPAVKFVINPLTGDLAVKKDGLGHSYRCDNAVAAYRYMLIEMDGEPVDIQTRIWTTIVRAGLLPVAAVYYSGGKSIHTLIRLSGVQCAADWARVVSESFYPMFAVPLGADGACKNPSRFSRTPGAQEDDRGIQWLLYIG